LSRESPVLDAKSALFGPFSGKWPKTAEKCRKVTFLGSAGPGRKFFNFAVPPGFWSKRPLPRGRLKIKSNRPPGSTLLGRKPGGTVIWNTVKLKKGVKFAP
jgi:hypothetical protein